MSACGPRSRGARVLPRPNQGHQPWPRTSGASGLVLATQKLGGITGSGTAVSASVSDLVATRETTFKPVPLEFTRLDAEEALRRSQEFLQLMETRRSVRHFSSEPVPYELIENAIRTAGTAPSGANQQPWTFVVVSDRGLKERLREAAEHEERLLYEQRASQEYLDAIEPIGTDWIKTHITDAPALIVVFEQSYG